MNNDQPSNAGSGNPPASPNNQPINPNMGQPASPITSQPIAPSTTQPTPATGVIGSGAMPAPETPPKKKRTGLIVGLILAFLVLVGGIAFAVFAIIKNQPENVMAESFSNLINAKQVAVSGSFTYTPKGELSSSVGPINVTIDTKVSDLNQSSDTTVSATFANTGKTIELSLGEVILNNGVFYVKASGVTKLYQEFLSGMIDEYLSTAALRYSSMSADPAVVAAINEYVAEIKTRIENIVKKVDDQWFEFSMEDILNSDLISQSLNQASRDSILKTYNCVVEKTNEAAKNSNEFSDLYAKNRFIKLESSSDSYYKVSLDAENTANFINALPDTKLFSGLTECATSGAFTVNSTTFDSAAVIESTTPSVSADDIANAIKNIPDIYFKFDGFLDHHLVGVKVEDDSDYYSSSVNLNLAYPSNLSVTAPANSRPIMELVEDVIGEVTALYQGISTLYQ